MKYRSLQFILCFLFTANSILAQNKILMLDGRIKEVKQYELKGDWIFYKKTNDPKDKLRKLDKFDVFSATKPDGMEEIIYDPDTAMEGDPNVEQVRRYIRGEQYAMAVYHKPWNSVGGAVAGFGSSVAGYYGPAGVFLYALIVGRFNARHIPSTTLIEPEVFNTDEFKAGYYKHSRNKKIKQSLIWGGIGFAVGFPVFYTIFKN